MRTCHDENGSPKARYKTKAEAKKRLQKIAEHNRREGLSAPKEIYRCPECGFFHTAKRRRKRKVKKPVAYERIVITEPGVPVHNFLKGGDSLDRSNG